MNKRQAERGSISRFLTEDHRRLEHLLDQAGGHAGGIDSAPYEAFRAGLLRHIGMEERILFPAIQRAQQGRAEASLASSLAQLRLEHGALAALLMPSPSTAVLATIREILRGHDEIEESAGGPYEVGDDLFGNEAETILAALCAAPAVKVMPHSDSPAVAATLQRALARAGFSLSGAQSGTARGEARPSEP